MYSYLSRLRGQGLLERSSNPRRGRLSYRLTERGTQRIKGAIPALPQRWWDPASKDSKEDEEQECRTAYPRKFFNTYRELDFAWVRIAADKHTTGAVSHDSLSVSLRRPAIGGKLRIPAFESGRRGCRRPSPLWPRSRPGCGSLSPSCDRTSPVSTGHPSPDAPHWLCSKSDCNASAPR